MDISVAGDGAVEAPLFVRGLSLRNASGSSVDICDVFPPFVDFPFLVDEPDRVFCLPLVGLFSVSSVRVNKYASSYRINETFSLRTHF